MSRLPPGGRGGYPPPAGKYSAARSHIMNDKYMEEFERAWDELHALHMGEGGGAGGSGASAAGRTSLAAHQRNVYASLEDPSGPPPSYYRPPSSSGVRRTGASPARGARPGSSIGPGPLRTVNNPSPSQRTSGTSLTPVRRPSPAAGGGSGSRGGGGGGGDVSRYPGRVSGGWSHGPTDPAGVLCDLSDRPNTCSAADWSRGEVVIGSTDHALYVLDVNRGLLRKRTLYSKASGHSEWVTSVTFASQGRIVSGGMDSKLWVWPAAGNKGMVAEAHFGPISQVKYDKSTDMVASASYDKTIRLWELGARPHEAGCLQGHEAPVLEMQIKSDGRIVSGDRSGHVLLWDINVGDASWRMRNVHQGHVTALAWFDESGAGEGAGCFVTGGQDGVVRVWDPRAKANVAKVQLHVNEQGHGAVGDIIAGGPAVAGMVVTAGADGTCRVLDPRLGFALAGTTKLTNFPYSMTAAGGTVVVGCGDGSIHFIDVLTSHTLYALGANRAAVRCMEAAYDKLVCSGDDGKAIMYSFA